MQRMPNWVSLAFFAAAILLASPGWAEHFTFRRTTANGKEYGVVVGHGMDLFEITTTAGGIPPLRRAEIIAERLENLSNWHDFSPGQFSVGFRNGEVIIQQQEHAAHLPHIIVTVDRRLAKNYPGANGSVERLAQWWLALLRDHLCLANGQKPIYTTGTPVGALFQKLYTQLGNPTEPVGSEEVERVVAMLSSSERRAFATAASSVPETFRPERTIVGDPESHREHPKGQEPAEHEPGHSPGETNTPNSRVKTGGKYLFVLTTDPKMIPVGEQTALLVQVLDEEWKAVANASLRGGLTKAGEETALSIPARFDEEARAYRFETTFDSAGNYRFTIGMTTDQGDEIKVEFMFTVGTAAKTK